jgi:hypothetical protein
MSIELNHTIVWCRDSAAASRRRTRGQHRHAAPCVGKDFPVESDGLRDRLSRNIAYLGEMVKAR